MCSSVEDQIDLRVGRIVREAGMLDLETRHLASVLSQVKAQEQASTQDDASSAMSRYDSQTAFLADNNFPRILSRIGSDARKAQTLRSDMSNRLIAFSTRANTLHCTYRNRIIHDPSIPTAPEQVKDGITHFRIQPDTLYGQQPLISTPVSIGELENIAVTYQHLRGACRALNFIISEQHLNWPMTDELRAVTRQWLAAYDHHYTQSNQ